jgi:methylphosphotriester-DNA--protein-cysteine methyltransferase
MFRHTEIDSAELRSRIRKQLVCLAGNRKLKIYGLLNCASGKRMKMKNRVFFQSEDEALNSGFRPCGHCMNVKYKVWKDGLVQ